MKTITLPSGHDMPMLGLGTWAMDAARLKDAFKMALDMGYRHIDTALVYNNQTLIGEALAEYDAPREKLFLTSKVNRGDLHHDGVLSKCAQALEELRTDYLDLFLIHWPDDVPMRETFEAMGELVRNGQVRSIGVSNFTTALVKEAVEASPVPICTNQVEYHPHLNQEVLKTACEEMNVVLTAYSPLSRGRVLDDPSVVEACRRTGRTAPQVVLRWLLQKGIIVIPKATSEAHLRENFDVFSFELPVEAMASLDNIKTWHRYVAPDFAPFED